MQVPEDDAPTSHLSAAGRRPGIGGLLAAAQALLMRAWRYAPTYPARLSWPAAQLALLRTLCCGALVFGTLAPLRPTPHPDLYPAYVAAKLANEGAWDHIYHSSVWLHNGVDPVWDQRASEITQQPLGGTSFVYHPWYLQILRPVAAHVPFPAFQAGWVVMSKICIVLAGLGMAILFGLNTLMGQAFLTMMLGLSSPAVYGIELGQNVLPALVFALAAIMSWRSSAPLWLGGLCAALAWACKPWCAALIVLCLLLRGLRATLITGAALALVMAVLPSLVLPDVLMRHYREMTMTIARVSVFGFNNISILSILERFVYPDWSPRLFEWIPRYAQLRLRLWALGSAGLVMAAGAALWWLRRPASRYTIAAYLAFMLLPLGICWTHYFAFAIPLGLLCTFDAKSPLLLRALGTALLTIHMGIMIRIEVPLDYYLPGPVRYPWQQAAPMALTIVLILAALAFAPREETEEAR
ncbi:MAG TPA: glycosyltransferase 87 family protein [Polyangiaceae bacterium]|nr:glycosyltransferase 87 family protein [Polyangiaceae bacterium]